MEQCCGYGDNILDCHCMIDKVAGLLRDPGAFGCAQGPNELEDMQKQLRMANRLVVRAVDRYRYVWINASIWWCHCLCSL